MVWRAPLSRLFPLLSSLIDVREREIQSPRSSGGEGGGVFTHRLEACLSGYPYPNPYPSTCVSISAPGHAPSSESVPVSASVT